MTRVLRRAWIPLVIVIAIVTAGFTVHRIRSFGFDGIIVTPRHFADDPKIDQPKVVRYDIFGPHGAVADVNYLDLTAQPQRVDGVTLPWSVTLSTSAPAAMADIVAQGNSDSITCRITVNDEVKEEKTSNGVNAQTFCLVKAA